MENQKLSQAEIIKQIHDNLDHFTREELERMLSYSNWIRSEGKKFFKNTQETTEF